MNDPDRPYMPAQTAAEQHMQQPQSGPPSTTGEMGYGTENVALPQGPGKYTEQPGSKSLASLVDKFVSAAAEGLGSNEAQAALQELRIAAVEADEQLKQLGASQYPAPPEKQSKMHPETSSQKSKK